MLPKREFGIPTGKWRRVHHLSKSKRGFPSVNEGIDSELSAIHYRSVDDFTNIIMSLRQQGASEIRMGKIDIARAYRIMPLEEAAWCSLGFVDADGNPYAETRLCFGLKQGCRLFSSLSNTLSWILEHGLGVPNINYIDDFAFCSKDERSNRQAIEIANLMFELLGLPVQAEKTVAGASEMTFLGVLLDSDNFNLPLASPPSVRPPSWPW